MKNFKYGLKNSDQYIEVKLVYVLKTIEEVNHEFLVTEDLLSELNLKASKFIEYLKNNLERTDPSYEAAADLWSQNRYFDKERYVVSSPTSRNQLIEIISGEGTEYIEIQQPELNLKQPRGSK
tara:strand:+ start:2540 stop:2908 length:369 start_codon:yes stop_codon:yes gene_type:complete